jgi:hypothetical protein
VINLEIWEESSTRVAHITTALLELKLTHLEDYSIVISALFSALFFISPPKCLKKKNKNIFRLINGWRR